VAAANVERTIASIDAELNAVIKDGFTKQEIDESKGYLIGSLPRQLETNAAIASFLLNAETFGLGLDYDEKLPGLIGAVKKDDADAAAKRLLDPSKATIAVAGPWNAASSAPAESATEAAAPAPAAPMASSGETGA
jgi:zinc protease